MYHDRYSRRRAADSFHEYDRDKAKNQYQWSWSLFAGVFLVQVTSRSVWASLGVISAFLLADYGTSWVLLSTPIAFTVAWGLTEPWMKRFCQHFDSTTEYMYFIFAGVIFSWFGAIIAAQSPIQIAYLVPLIGVIGGCGANVAATASITLVRKHYPSRNGTVRFFEQITSSISFFVMPVISYFIMDAFGDHGGLLIHSGILMQGLIGGALLHHAKWKKTSRDRAYTFVSYEDESVFSNDSESEDGVDGVPEHLNPALKKDTFVRCTEKTNRSRRLAFGLGKAPDTPPERRKRKRTFTGVLPSIHESAEEDEEETDSQSDMIKTPTEDLPLPSSQINPIDNLKSDTKRVRTTNFNEVNDCAEVLVDPRDSSRNNETSIEPHMLDVSTLQKDKYEQEPSEDVVLTYEVLLRTAPSANPIAKPPRTFEHRFSGDRFIATADRSSFEEEDRSYDKDKIDWNEYSATVMPQEASKSMANQLFGQIKFFQEIFEQSWWTIARSVGRFTRHCLVPARETVNLLMNPLTIPAAFLLFSTQISLVTFISLTPVHLTFVEDGTWMDGAYCICIMGLAWLCFVLASPCFSTIHFTNHQAICVVALLSSASTLYLISESKAVDEIALYSSLFGISYGVARITTHSILKMSFGSQLDELQVHLSCLASIFQLISITIIGSCDWYDDLKNLYKLPVFSLLLAAIFWTMQGCVSSVRAQRGHQGLTWSRRRRFS